HISKAPLQIVSPSPRRVALSPSSPQRLSEDRPPWADRLKHESLTRPGRTCQEAVRAGYLPGKRHEAALSIAKDSSPKPPGCDLESCPASYLSAHSVESASDGARHALQDAVVDTHESAVVIEPPLLILSKVARVELGHVAQQLLQ